LPSPQHWFEALAHSSLGHTMQTSQWAFAVTEMVHLLALAALGGSVLFLDLRLLGITLRGESAAVISRDLGRILLVSLTVMILSGIGLLSEEAMKCYYSPAFRWKDGTPRHSRGVLLHRASQNGSACRQRCRQRSPARRRCRLTSSMAWSWGCGPRHRVDLTFAFEDRSRTRRNRLCLNTFHVSERT